MNEHIISVPIDQIKIRGTLDMETYDKSESYIHIFKCQDEKCFLEYAVFSWKSTWADEFIPHCPECGGQESAYLRNVFVKRKIYEIVHCPKLGQE